MPTDLQGKLSQLENLFTELNTHGMEGRAGTVWPVIIRQYYDSLKETTSYEYEYPYAFFNNLQFQKQFFLHSIEKKSERLPFAKLVIDKHMRGEIDIFLYHFGMYLIYRDYRAHRIDKDLIEESIGKKRVQFIQSLPISRFKDTDDFITSIWAYQIEDRDTDIGDYRRNPFMEKVRILFSNEQFASYTGHLYPGDVTWIEPISGKMDLECQKYSEEKDPMAPNKIPEGWVQGEIILGHEGSSGLRHFVDGVPIHAGSSIQIKWGNGWIPGRYEWSFDNKSKIQIHCNDDVFYINEGHRVRVRG